MLCIYRINKKEEKLAFSWELVKDCPQTEEEAWKVAEQLTEQTQVQHVVGSV